MTQAKKHWNRFKVFILTLITMSLFSPGFSQEDGLTDRWYSLSNFYSGKQDLFILLFLLLLSLSTIYVIRINRKLRTIHQSLEKELQDRKETEKEIRKLSYAVKHSASMVVITDVHGKIEYVNPKFSSVTGYPSEELRGVNPRIIKSGITTKEVFDDLWRTLRAGKEWHGEICNRKKNGELYWVSSSTSALLNEQGEITNYIAIQEDITARKKAEDELREAKKTAEVANLAKSQFLAKMSHELRTPLNAIIGYSEMLMEEAADLDEQEFIPDLEKIRSAGKHLLALINDILDLSKIEAGKMVLFLEDFDANAVIQDVIHTSKPLIDKNHNCFTTEIIHEPGIIFGDVTKFRQLLYNLISNASKFTENGNITLRVSREMRDNQEVLVVSVSDTGIGMTPEQLQRVFKEFVQADTTITSKYGGTGLGLAICKKFCEMMGGNIEVQSEFKSGSVFTFWLPVRMVDKESAVIPTNENAPQDTKLFAKAAESLQPHQNKVLVIDDDPQVLDIIRHYLEKEGYLVLTALGGEKGLELAKSEHPIAITLDVVMPKMDGWEVLMRLKSDAELSNIPVIMLSFMDNYNMGYALGVTDYLTKPVDKERLLNLLQKFKTDKSQNRILVVEDNPSERELTMKILLRDGFVGIPAENGKVALDIMKETIPDLILLDLLMPEMDGFQFIEELRKHAALNQIPVVVMTSKDLTKQEYDYLEKSVHRVLQKGGLTSTEILQEVHHTLKNIIRLAG